ncbi:MAG: hydantoinase/oxoprolinase family protein [Burkholderiaceae bacterium]
MIVGVEIGGTFTDVILVAEDGRLVTHKVRSTPEDPSEAGIRGIREILEHAGRAPRDVTELIHGSTIATNTLLQRRGARTALLATRGFADLLFIGRTSKTAMYDLHYRKPEPLVAADKVFEVDERVDGQGRVLSPLRPETVMARLEPLIRAGEIEAVAICLLNAYANAEHEQALGRQLRERFPELAVTLSTEVTPEHREYERTSTASINAYVQPAVTRYLRRFAERSAALGIRAAPLIMLSNGGVVPIDVASREAARMLLSGPVAAVTGGSHVGASSGLGEVITVDVGGTSTDVCLIEAGQPRTTTPGTAESSIDGLAINVVMTDVCTIGSGGGSIAHVDAAGLLKVGPQSAGAQPGPACYGRGGEAFTVTDALLLVGYLDAEAPLADGLRLDSAAAQRAAGVLARQLGGEQDPVALAHQVIRIAVADMARALRRVSVRRGRDPRDYALLPCGGCGPLLAAAIADEMNIRRILVPEHAGIFSAFGLAVSDLRLDASRADLPAAGLATLDASPEALDRAFEALRSRSVEAFERMGFDRATLGHRAWIDMRYHGQGYELRIATEPGEALAALAQRFDDEHIRQYGYRLSAPVELVALRTAVTRRRAPLPPPVVATRSASPPALRRIAQAGAVESWPVIARETVGSERLDGPLLIAEANTTTVVPAGWQAHRDNKGLVHLDRISND